MDESAKVVTRSRVDMLIGTIVLAGALVALCLPVYLGTYDRWGVEIKCGNGYHSQLLQATTDDQDQARRSAPATDLVDQCKSALLHRRAWTIPVGAVGALILVPELVAWARGRSAGPAQPTHESSTEPADLHDAALLDRRYRSHRERSPDTTL
jgi:hypothetical protein